MKALGTFCTFAVMVGLAACGNDATPPPVTPQKEVTKESPPPVATALAVAPPALKDDVVPATTSNAEALAAYNAGLDLYDNARTPEAREQFAKARKLDPKFWSAVAGEGAATPGGDGDKLLADAVAQSGALPESEHVLIKIFQAVHADDQAKALELATKLVALVPKARRSHESLGGAQSSAGKYEDAVASYKKAVALEPTAAAVYNELAYVELLQNKLDDATTHLKKYVELRPNEANAHDSLGEILLLGGKLDEAAASFEKAVSLSPKFGLAWGGLGMVSLYKGDHAKAYEAFGKQRDVALTIQQKGGAARNIAVGQLTQNKVADALKTIDAFDAEAAKAKAEEPTVWSAIDRAGVLLEGGRPAEALKVLTPLSAKIDKLEAESPRKQRMHGYDFQLQTMANARLGKAADADKARASTEDVLSKLTDAEARGVVSSARGEALMTKGDAKGAAEAYKGCLSTDDWCSLQRMKAQEKAGDKGAATATKEALRKLHRRDAWSFFAYSRAK